MSIPISGILLDPYGNVARFADIKLVTLQGSGDVIETSNSTFRTDESGAYAMDVQFGRFAVYMRFNGSNGSYTKIQAITVNSDTIASTLGELLAYTEPLTPDEILIVQALVNEAIEAKDLAQAAALSAGLDADSAAADALSAANSVALLAPVPLNGGVWASGQIFTAYNQYMIFGGEAYSPLQATVLPYTVGASPDLGFVYQIKLNSLQLLSGLTEPSDLAQRHRIKTTVAEMATGVFKDGDVLEVTDRDNGHFKVEAGIPDGFGMLEAGGGNVAKIQISRGATSFTAFGAIGDFNPATGIGTDSRPAIQACVNYMITLGGGKIDQHVGKFYLGTGYNKPAYAHQVSIGDQDGTVVVKVPSFDTSGAEFYVGAEGKGFVYAMAKDSKWEGFKAYGYTGGALGSWREQDTPLLINKKSDNIEICGGYITNSLGDCITISPDVTVAGGGLGSSPTNIKIHHNTLKERFGNGTQSVSGGTKSREAIAIIEGIDVNIHDNLIIGSVDLEPNSSGQYIVRCKIDNNILNAGHVEPQSSIGTLYWHDEPTAITGGTLINNDIKLQGVAGAPIIEGNTCDNNTIEHGRILTSRVYEFDSVDSNTFKYGAIQLGADTTFGSARFMSVQNNTCKLVYPTYEGFITLNGQVVDSLISGNSSQDPTWTCVKVGTPAVGPVFDQGNTFKSNISGSANAYVGTFNKLSVVNGADKILNADYSKQVVFTISGTNLTIDWAEHGGNSWYIQQAGGTATSIANIINIPGDGFILNIMAEASGGGNLTIQHSTNIITKSAANVVLTNTGSINIIENFGRRVQI